MIPWLIRKPFSACRTEIGQWFRASLSRLPGSIGSWLRNKFYGYHPGKKSRVQQHVVIYHPQRLTLGVNVQISIGCHLNAGGGIDVGDNTLIGPRVSIWSQNHIYTSADLPICQQGYEYSLVKIEEDVWIGCGAIILPGVTLRRGCVIGAGAVVTRSTDPYTVYAGVPARAIKKRTSIESPNEAAERRKKVAHGASHGWQSQTSQPRSGERTVEECTPPIT
jgi:maltose O-acetyltransferase